jgi:NitT/TauT family transport system substrate-binding protein
MQAKKAILLGLLSCGILVVGCRKSSTDQAREVKEHVSLRLEWYPQAQFAGYLVAASKGFYQAQGLDVELRPAGPDLKPQMTVASGTDDLGVGVANQVVVARSGGVPLRIVAQMFQDSANRYVLKRRNSISSLKELRGKKVGLWLGGDEAEFISMLKTAQMSFKDVHVIPQGYTVTPFLQDQYVLSEVTSYNELLEINRAGFSDHDLQVLSPAQFNSAILGDMLFTTERFIRERPSVTNHFILASLQGWQYCFNHRQEVLDIILKSNPSLNRDEQAAQLDAILTLISAGSARSRGIGAMDVSGYQQTINVLVDSNQIPQPINPSSVFDSAPWDAVPSAFKQIP